MYGLWPFRHYRYKFGTRTGFKRVLREYLFYLFALILSPSGPTAHHEIK